MSNQSEKVEAFFEGASNVYEGAQVNFSSQKIVIREIGDANKHAYRNADIVAVGGTSAVELFRLPVDNLQSLKLMVATLELS